MLERTIYFIRCPTLNAIKIGQAGNPGKRLAEMQVGCPATLVLHGQFRGVAGDEGSLHARFREQRIRGEWFTETPEMMEFIARVIAKGMPRQTWEEWYEQDRRARQIYAPVDRVDFSDPSNPIDIMPDGSRRLMPK